MRDPFDIFERDADGNVLWHGTAASLEEAQTLIRQLANATSGEYFVWDQEAGSRLVIKLREDNSSQASQN